MLIQPLEPKHYVRKGGLLEAWHLTEENLLEVCAAVNTHGDPASAKVTLTREGDRVLTFYTPRDEVMFRAGPPSILMHERGRWYKVQKIIFNDWFEKPDGGD